MAVYWDDNLRFVDDNAPFGPPWRMDFRLTSTELSISDLSKLFTGELVFAASDCKSPKNTKKHRDVIDVNRDFVIIGLGQPESHSTYYPMAT